MVISVVKEALIGMVILRVGAQNRWVGFYGLLSCVGSLTKAISIRLRVPPCQRTAKDPLRYYLSDQSFLKFRSWLVVLASLVLLSCGGGDGGEETGNGSGSDNGSTNKPSKPLSVTNLPTVADYGIVTEIGSLDLNRDGALDLLLFRTKDNPFYSGVDLQILINNSDDSFTDETASRLSGLNHELKFTEKAYLADVNGDALLDVVSHVDVGGDNIPLMLQTADGRLEVTSNAQVHANKGGTVPIDSDNDGDTDLLVRNVRNFGRQDQYHEWKLLMNVTTNPVDLKFELAGVVSSGGPTGNDQSTMVYSPVIIDVNHDGYEDIVFGGAKWKSGFVDEPAPLQVYLNDKNNRFQYSDDSLFNGVTPAYTHLREADKVDIDGDNDLDIVITNHGYDRSPYRGEFNATLIFDAGAFSERRGTEQSHDYDGFTHCHALGDIDNDGDVDIVYVDITGDDVKNGEEIRVLVNDGTGRFPNSHYLDAGDGTWISAKLVDLNNDGNLDLALGAIDSHSQSKIVWGTGLPDFSEREN